MSFVGPDYLLSLAIHVVDIVFVSIVQVFHFANQVISFVSELPKVVFKSSFLGLRVCCALFHCVQLIIQVAQAVTVTFMLSLELSELIVLPEERSVDLTGLSGNAFSSELLVAEAREHIILFFLKPVEFRAEFLVEFPLIPQVFL